MLKQKFSGSVQEVILPDFPDDDDNTVTTTVTKSRRVSFGPNFVKEFIVDSAISAQCMSEYEELFPSSDSSSAHSSHSAVGHSSFVLQENVKFHRPVPPEPESAENHPKPPKFASTICFSADSPTADMEFTEGCITLAKSILDKKNKEMTLFIQAKPKGPKEEEKGKEEETNYFEGSQFEMSMTRCLKSREKKGEEKRFVGEKTKIFGKYDDEMSMTRCGNYFIGTNDESDSNWEESKENRMPLDAIMQHLDKDDSVSDLFNPERSFAQLLGANTSDLSDESEKLNLNESMEISGDLQVPKPPISVEQCEHRANQMSAIGLTEQLDSNELQVQKTPVDMVHCKDQPNQMSAMELAKRLDLNKLQVQKTPIDMVHCEDRPNQTSAMELTEQLDLNELQVQKPPIDVARCEDRPNQTSAMELTEKLNSNELQVLKTSVKTQYGDRLNQMLAMELTEPLDSNELQVQKTPVDVAQCEDRPNQTSAVELKTPENVKQCEDRPNQTSAMELTEKLDLNELQVQKTPVDVEQCEDRPNQTSAVELTEKLDLNELQVQKTPVDVEQCEDRPNQTSAVELTEKLDLNELQVQKTPANVIQCGDRPNQTSAMELAEELDSNDFATGFGPAQSFDDKIVSDELPQMESSEKAKVVELSKAGSLDVSEGPLSFVVDVSVEETATEGLVDSGLPRNPFACAGKMSKAAGSEGMIPDQEDDIPREPSLGDLKVIESLKEQAEEKGCVWFLNDVRHPQRKTQGLLSFRCRLLESTTTLEFTLKMSDEDSLDSCSIVTDSNIFLDEEKQCRLPEYSLTVGLGFEELKKYFGSSQTVGTVRHVPYYMDQVNSFLSKMNAYLLQIYSVLTSYPGSRLKDCRLSFRLFSFPIFFSCVVSIDLSNVFRLSKASLMFEHDFGCMDEKKVEEIFEECLKGENSLCEFVVQSTKYLVELEKQSGYVSKRKHIRLLPDELKL